MLFPFEEVELYEKGEWDQILHQIQKDIQIINEQNLLNFFIQFFGSSTRNPLVSNLSHP